MRQSSSWQLAEVHPEPTDPPLQACLRELQGREFACRPLPHLFRHLERAGYSLNELLEGVPYPLSHLLDVTERIDWGSLSTICANLSKRCSEAEIIELGRASLQARSMRIVAIFARLLLTPTEYYRFAARELNRYCACLGASIRHVGERRMECQVFLQPGYRAQREVFLALQGAFIGMNQIYGDQPAHVEMEEIEGGALYQIRLPDDRGIISAFRRVATWTLTARSAARNLRDANDLLHERQVALLRKDAELVASERNYRSLLDQAFDAVLILDSSGRLVDVNFRACEALMRSRETLLRCDPRELIELAGGTLDGLLSSLRHAPTARVEAIVRRGDGSTLPVEIGCTTLADGRVQAVLRDISERHRMDLERQRYANQLELQLAARAAELERANQDRKELQARLLEAERRCAVDLVMGQLVSTLHEPLGTLVGKLERIAASACSVTSTIQEGLRLARRARETVERSIADLGSGGHRPHARESAASILRDVEDSLAPIAAIHHTKLELHVGADLPPIHGDRALLVRALTAIAVNGLEAMEEGGTLVIEVDSSPDQSSVRYSIRDDGCGIAVQLRDRVFEPFFTTKPAHAGLGLTIALGVARGHGARLEIESPGRGTVVTFELPCRVSRDIQSS